MAQTYDTQSLWEKYEDIAMHFNDLLMKLRMQSLAGIAALSTVIGVFAKEGIGGVKIEWGVAEALFTALALFWVAIWSLDFLYYNRLLMGAVTALKELEAECKPGKEFTVGIKMSTVIEDEFRHSFWERWPSRFHGVLLFYGIVFAVIIAGLVYSAHMKP
ncbi:MAG: hypothetical protein ABI454_09450 [Sphingomicrobium sp.]